MRQDRNVVLDFAPVHGDQGDREAPPLASPLGVSVAISREAGARGTSIAKRLCKRLGWDLYTQELLEYFGADEVSRSKVLAEMPPEAAGWAEQQLGRLRRDRAILSETALGELPRLALTLAARGRVVLVGRGAGYLLPNTTTVHVRIVAPKNDRIAYLSQSLRMTSEQAEREVAVRDEVRAEFLHGCYGRRVGEATDYDAILNSSLLGEEACAELICGAIAAKEAKLGQ